MTCIAVIMTCHNRRDTTLRCLRQLDSQALPHSCRIRTYLVDDGSTDGTAEAVAVEHPEVSVVPGTGNLYWTGGMLLADAAAMADDPDYLLWLNDDVELADGAIASLIDTARNLGDKSIVVGATVDPDSGAATYGGYRRFGRPLDLQLVEPNGELQRVDTMNGNVVLVPRMVRERVGALDGRFQHNMSDMDYGFRAVRAGFDIVVAPETVGACRKNTSKGKWGDPTVPLQERIRAVRSFKGLPPGQWLRFTVRHTGWWWPRYFVSPYARALWPSRAASRAKGAE